MTVRPTLPSRSVAPTTATEAGEKKYPNARPSDSIFLLQQQITETAGESVNSLLTIPPTALWSAIFRMRLPM